MILFGNDRRVEAVSQRINGWLASEHIVTCCLEVDSILAAALRRLQDAEVRMDIAVVHGATLRGDQRVRRVANFPVGVLRDPREGPSPFHFTALALSAENRRVGDFGINHFLLLGRASSQDKNKRERGGVAEVQSTFS